MLGVCGLSTLAGGRGKQRLARVQRSTSRTRGLQPPLAHGPSAVPRHRRGEEGHQREEATCYPQGQAGWLMPRAVMGCACHYFPCGSRRHGCASAVVVLTRPCGPAGAPLLLLLLHYCGSRTSHRRVVCIFNAPRSSLCSASPGKLVWPTLLLLCWRQVLSVDADPADAEAAAASAAAAAAACSGLGPEGGAPLAAFDEATQVRSKHSCIWCVPCYRPRPNALDVMEVLLPRPIER